MADQPPTPDQPPVVPPPPPTPAHPPRVRLGVISFGLALGVTAAIFTFILGITAALFGWGAALVDVLANLYIGYGPHFVGSIAGAVWAFVVGLVAGMLVAWLYNAFLRSRRRDG